MTLTPTTEPRRRRLDRGQVIDAADRLVAERGWDALTMAALGEELGVKPSSLYRHVESVDAIRLALQLRTVTELGEAARNAVMGRSGEDGLYAIADAYRAYARKHAERYLGGTRYSNHDDVRAAGRLLIDATYAVVVRSMGLPEDQVVSFHDVTRGAVDRLDVIVRFLAVLELYKQGVVDLEQVATFADLSVRRLTTGEALDALSIADWDAPVSAPASSGERGGS